MSDLIKRYGYTYESTGLGDPDIFGEMPDGEFMLYADHKAEIERLEKYGIEPPEGYVRREPVQALVDGLLKTNWSSWQTTAHFQKELDAVEAMLTAAKEST